MISETNQKGTIMDNFDLRKSSVMENFDLSYDIRKVQKSSIMENFDLRYFFMIVDSRS